MTANMQSSIQDLWIRNLNQYARSLRKIKCQDTKIGILKTSMFLGKTFMVKGR